MHGQPHKVHFCVAALTALAFLTRLAPAKMLSGPTLRAAVAWYAPTGAIVGILALLPWWTGLWSASPAIQALLYVGISAWITRGLHWDGLMDLADAWGSSAGKDKFWDIMKDSRAGAFAVLAVFFLGGGQCLAASTLLAKAAWQPLLLAPLAGRAACVLLLASCPAWPGSSLAQLVKAGATGPVCCSAVMLALLAGLWLLGLSGTLLLCAATLVLLFCLRRIALKNGGLNGDFLGAAILLTELFTLLIASAS